MNHDYTLISDLTQMPMQGVHPPAQMNSQADMFNRYLRDSDNDSDSESEDSESGDGNWQHYYGVLTLIMLAVIIWYVYKIRAELVGMYEEA